MKVEVSVFSGIKHSWFGVDSLYFSTWTLLSMISISMLRCLRETELEWRFKWVYTRFCRFIDWVAVKEL